MKKKITTHQATRNKTACCCKDVNENLLLRAARYVPAMYYLYKFSNDLHPQFWSAIGSADWHAIKEVISAILKLS